MGWLVQHWFAVVLFAGYTTLLIIHARAGLKVSDAMGEYFVGGRRGDWRFFLRDVCEHQ